MNYYICDGKIIDNAITGVKSGSKNLTKVSAEEFAALTAELNGCLLYLEGEEVSSHDSSDDERSSSYRSSHPFGYYYEINPKYNSEHLLRIDGRIRGVVFHVSGGYNKLEYCPFLFDGSVPNEMMLGYSASHSSSYIYVQKVTLVKKGTGGAPDSAKPINFCIRRSDTYI